MINSNSGDNTDDCGDKLSVMEIFGCDMWFCDNFTEIFDVVVATS